MISGFIGLLLSVAWLGGAAMLLEKYVGLANIEAMLPNEQAFILAGLSGPLALIWILVTWVGNAIKLRRLHREVHSLRSLVARLAPPAAQDYAQRTAAPAPVAQRPIPGVAKPAASGAVARPAQAPRPAQEAPLAAAPKPAAAADARPAQADVRAVTESLAKVAAAAKARGVAAAPRPPAPTPEQTPTPAPAPAARIGEPRPSAPSPAPTAAIGAPRPSAPPPAVGAPRPSAPPPAVATPQPSAPPAPAPAVVTPQPSAPAPAPAVAASSPPAVAPPGTGAPVGGAAAAPPAVSPPAAAAAGAGQAAAANEPSLSVVKGTGSAAPPAAQAPAAKAASPLSQMEALVGTTKRDLNAIANDLVFGLRSEQDHAAALSAYSGGQKEAFFAVLWEHLRRSSRDEVSKRVQESGVADLVTAYREKFEGLAKEVQTRDSSGQALQALRKQPMGRVYDALRDRLG